MSKWDKYLDSGATSNKWSIYDEKNNIESVSQSGQNAYRDAQSTDGEGLLTPLRGATDFVSGLAGMATGAVDSLAGTHLKNAVEPLRQQAQDTISQGNKNINTFTDNLTQKHQENLGYTSGITDPLGYASEDIPAAAAHAIQGVSKLFSGASRFVSGGIDTLSHTFSPEGNNKYFMKAEQGGMDAISGALQVLSAPAPLLPDIIEKPLTDVMSIPTHVADYISDATASLFKVDPSSPQGAMLRQGFENVAGLLMVKSAPAAQEKVFGKKTEPTVLQKEVESGYGFKPDVLKASKELGVEAPAPVYNQSPTVRLLYALGSKGFFGNVLAEKVNTFTNDLGAAVTRLKDKISPVVGKLEAGNTMIEGFKDYISNINSLKKSAYDEVGKIANDAPADTTKTVQIGQQIKTNMSNSILPNEVNKYIDPILNRILEKDPETGISKPINFQTLKETRTQLGDIINTAFTDPIVGRNESALKQLYHAMGEDIDATVTAISPETGKVLQNANALHKEFMNSMQSYFGKKFSEIDDITKITEPENLLKSFIKKDTYSHLPELKNVIGEEGTAALKGGFLLDAVEKSMNGEQFSPAKFSKYINDYKDTVQVLFNDTERQKIAQIKLLSDASQPLAKVMEGSQTAFSQKLSNTLGAGGIGGATASFMLGNYGTSLAILGSALAPEVLSSFLFKTKLGEEILQSNIPGMEAIKGAARTAKNVRNEIRPVTTEIEKAGFRQQPKKQKEK